MFTKIAKNPARLRRNQTAHPRWVTNQYFQ
jgi:hypothetical protein